jgi:hypothetical protein
MRASRTFGDSYDGLLQVVQWIALVLTALLPWTPVLAVAAIATWVWRRRVS